ncbi:MAG: peptide chain release factor 2, partial [Pseudomonadota bacterium]
MRAEVQNNVEAIAKSVALLKRRIDWETAPHRMEEFDAMIEDPTLWDDPARAQKLMRDRQTLKDGIEGIEALERDT